MEGIDISRIKLSHHYVAGAGHQIRAFFGQKFKCVEFVMRDDVPQPITYVSPSDITPRFRAVDEMHLMSEPWIQFAPKEWDQFIDVIFKELVRLWNKEHGKEIACHHQDLTP